MKIKNLKDKMMLFEKMVNNNNLKTIESPINSLTPVYHFIFPDKTLTFSTYSVKSNKLFVSIKLLV